MSGKTVQSRYFVRSILPYRNGEKCYHGQVLDLSDGPGDQRLLRLGYVAELPRDAELATCAECGLEFINHNALHRHGKEAHDPRFAGVVIDPVIDPEVGGGIDDSEDVALDSEQRRILADNPIFVENSLAALKG